MLNFTDKQKARILEIEGELAGIERLKMILETPEPFVNRMVADRQEKILKLQNEVDYYRSIIKRAPIQLPGIISRIEDLNSERKQMLEAAKESIEDWDLSDHIKYFTQNGGKNTGLTVTLTQADHDQLIALLKKANGEG